MLRSMIQIIGYIEIINRSLWKLNLYYNIILILILINLEFQIKLFSLELINLEKFFG